MMMMICSQKEFKDRKKPQYYILFYFIQFIWIRYRRYLPHKLSSIASGTMLTFHSLLINTPLLLQTKLQLYKQLTSSVQQMAYLDAFCIRKETWIDIVFLVLVGCHSRPRMQDKIRCHCISHRQNHYSLCLYQHWWWVMSLKNVHCKLSEPEPLQGAWHALWDCFDCNANLRTVHLGRN
jgi:hypothetical protein